ERGAGTARKAAIELRAQPGAQIVTCLWSELGGFIEWIAVTHPAHGFDQRLGGKARDAAFHQEALGADAALPGIVEARGDGRLYCLIEIGIGKDDERVRATEFEHGLLADATGSGGNGATGTDAAGDGDASDAVVGNDAG